MESPPSSSQTPQSPTASALNLRGVTMGDYLKVEPRLSVEQKAAFAGHLVAGLNAQASSVEDFAQAEAILRLLAWNAEPPIVDAMARAVAANPHAPRSLAWALANEDDVAAERVLEVSSALSDGDLVSIVQSSSNLAKLGAVARRPAVSAEVSRSLAHHGDGTVLQILLANAQAEISDDAYGTVLDRFGQDERIVENIIDRESVTPAIVQRVSEAMPSPRIAEKIAARKALPFISPVHAAAVSATVPTAESAPPLPSARTSLPAVLPGFADEQSDDAWQARFAQMIADKSLNEWALVRHLCLGNFDFFARALALLAKAPKDDVVTQLLSDPSASLPELWKAALLPADWLSIASAALAALIQIDRSANKTDRDLFSRNIMDRTVANLKSQKVVLSSMQLRFFGRRGLG